MVAHTPNLKDENKLPVLGSRYVDVASLPWESGRWDGIRSKTLMEDPERGLKTALIEWSPGASLPFHEHVEIEQSYVLEGSFEDDDGERPIGKTPWKPPHWIVWWVSAPFVADPLIVSLNVKRYKKFATCRPRCEKPKRAQMPGPIPKSYSRNRSVFGGRAPTNANSEFTALSR